MPSAIIKLRRTISRRIGLGIVLLTAISVSLVITILWLFGGLMERQSSVAQSVREDAIWAAYQADREASRLIETILLDDRDAVSLRYDLLFSRIGLIGSGHYAITFDNTTNGEQSVSEAAKVVATSVLDLEPLVAQFVVDGSAAALLSAAQATRETTGQLIVAANAAINAARVNERAIAQQTFLQLGVAVAFLAGALLLMVALLTYQLVHISRSGRELVDLSERNKRAAEMAQSANRAKSAFLATMSHEIRTPLNGIIGMTELLDSPSLTSEQQHQVAIIRKSGELLLDVITDILDYSKLEAGALTIEPAAVDLGDVESAIRDVLGARARAAGLAFEVSLPHVRATCDAGRLRQVLLNLVGNAIKFTPTGLVRVVGSLSGETLRIDVIDSGIGISPEARPQLFKDFSQVDKSNTRVHGGTGLGLAISRRLVEAMNGTIGVDSEPGHGSTFWLEIPVGPISASAGNTNAASASELTLPAARVLLAEDNPINREVAAGLLKGLGLDVTFARNGQEAFDATLNDRPDLVIMDMQMPVMDGLESTRKLRMAGFSGPIVGLTANAFVTDRDACLAAGMDAFMAKPVTRARLLETLSPLLGTGETAAAQTAPQPAAEVDLDYQKMLRDELGEDVFADLHGQFLADVPGMLVAASDALAASDARAYDAVLHTLKGAALSMGYTGIAERANRARSDMTDGATQLADLSASLVSGLRVAA